MAYFSNGTEGMDYEAQWCDRCVHQGPVDGPGCMVWLVHNLHNYEQHSNAGVQSVLTTLIPLDTDGANLKCRMFSPETRKD